MINSYRTAFIQGKKEDSIGSNLENVVNLTQTKLKELNNKHQDKIRENNYLKSQANQMENDVKFLEREISKKNQTVPLIKQEMEKLELEIQQGEREYNIGLKEYNKKNEDFFNTMLLLDDEMQTANAKNLAEETKKKSKYRIEYEKYLRIKDENQRLTEMMFNLRRDLYLIEVLIISDNINN
jgi:hypothetical protein